MHAREREGETGENRGASWAQGCVQKVSAFVAAHLVWRAFATGNEPPWPRVMESVFVCVREGVGREGREGREGQE